MMRSILRTGTITQQQVFKQQLIRHLSSSSFPTSSDQFKTQEDTNNQIHRKIIPPSTAVSDSPYVLYHNPRRWQSFGLTTLAGGQAAFWSYAAGLSLQLSTTPNATELLSPAWTVGGFGLSAMFAWMVHAYLKRLVAHVDLMVNKTGPLIRVSVHRPFGRMSEPITISAQNIVHGPSKDNPDVRHWTFGIVDSSKNNENRYKNEKRKKRPFYYILDMKKSRTRLGENIKDLEGLKAIVNGGEAFMAWSHKRDARIMRQRWKDWKNVKQAQINETPNTNLNQAENIVKNT